MPNRININSDELNINIINEWKNNWFLLTAGNNEKYNTMTIAWGSVGVMWFKPFIQVVVRPTRYTRLFMEKHDTFTVCGFDKQYKNDLQLLGSQSGRDSDKIKETNLTITTSNTVDSPCFDEANIIFECKKMYFQDMNPKNFLDKEIHKHYPEKDYHRIYFGEILDIFGIEDYKI